MFTFKNLGHQGLVWAEMCGLVIVAIATIVAMGHQVVTMFEARLVTLADLLLLFIYLEVLAMVSMYLEMGKLPIRLPLYIAIVALARYLILDMKEMDSMRMLTVAGTVLLLAISVFIIRYGHSRFPYQKED
ncbi:MAG: phosphate-starvation-inducible protein PsiE [Aeromonadaceae bacterium]